ncbi:hypothetical protein J6590_063941, partial [Homalodisca vitripennis]
WSRREERPKHRDLLHDVNHRRSESTLEKVICFLLTAYERKESSLLKESVK